MGWGAPVTRASSGLDFELLLVDGNNLLHRTHGSVGPGAQRALFVQLRAALPGVRKIVVFDGHRETHQGPVERPAGGLEVRYAGGAADDALVRLIGEVPWQRRGWTVLVTDDRALADRARTAGARTQRLDWLVEMLGRPGRRTAGGSLGRRQP